MPADSISPVPFDTRAFRKALGCFPTGVAVITAQPSGQLPVGLTINSFASVSLDPPLVLWSLQRDAPSKDAILQSGHFVVNVLDETQLRLAQQFARPAIDKFDGVEISTNRWGAPYIKKCIARFECKVMNCVDGGDHVIFLGEVEHFHHETGAPLVFCHGMFASVADTRPKQITG
ncbi:flavin reductase (DIM6/NTAB) family NADH-FMN oxidoreductase RutF [Afipia massiliensis]|jgi:4-hydroxyphenylacetate 3-hydroxylase, reductase component|uniref:Flavin reductase (DIM6/NTAB) family NADH-FMN oxidoreductase RutF n=1 Tax=Afipia massiliensis TaxID=211460 RepID=A0A840N3Y9_9BRAD|nr:flavin reductase family protein [Afipia massiliensis]MBB5053622.1 flavin reductase (DIM6/NTAB) family NADH-FMN oxidoreductase RutF [Afipia massiliensis]